MYVLKIREHSQFLTRFKMITALNHTNMDYCYTNCSYATEIFNQG